MSDGEEKGVYGKVFSYVRSGGKYEERRGEMKGRYKGAAGIEEELV